MSEPKKVRLAEDYLDLETGTAYSAGTILIRSPHGTGQYMPGDLRLGQPGAIASFSLIQSISETIE